MDIVSSWNSTKVENGTNFIGNRQKYELLTVSVFLHKKEEEKVLTLCNNMKTTKTFDFLL